MDQSDRQKIVYVCSLGRSGSTILGILLSQMENAVCLGEIQAALRVSPDNVKQKEYTCTCGEAMSSCEYWSRILKEKTGNEDPESQHALVLKHFKEQYPGQIMIDTSKFARSLATGWLANKNKDKVDLKVIFMVRDYRGWALSEQRKYGKRGRKKILLLHCLAWWFRNMAREKTLKALGVNVLMLSYESLVLNRDRELKRIAEFTGLILPEGKPETHNNRVHDCHGNNLRTDPKNYAELRYDYRWTIDPRYVWLAPLLLPVHYFWRRINNLSNPDSANRNKKLYEVNQS